MLLACSVHLKNQSAFCGLGRILGLGSYRTRYTSLQVTLCKLLAQWLQSDVEI